ncbi:MAG: hypothetical protein ABIK86_01570 [candidate division WOR-3 bacterium]
MPRSVLIIVLLAGGSCSRTPPSSPVLFGPSTAWPRDTLEFWVQAADPNHDSVSYQVLWQDGSDSVWSRWFPPAYQYRLKHVFADTGNYPVVALARNRRAVAEPSDTLFVRVAEFGPLVPRRPTGPKSTVVNDTLGWATWSHHQLDKRIQIRFDFGDTLCGWSEFVSSGTTVVGRHSYSRGGRFAIRAQARDERDHISEWSQAETVQVVDTFRWR